MMAVQTTTAMRALIDADVNARGAANPNPATLSALMQHLADSVQPQPVVAAVTPATTIDLTTAFNAGAALTYTPAQSATLNAPAPPTGQSFRKVFHILTSGTSSFTITFGTNMKSTGTLATGTVSGKKFTVVFESDGSTWNEISRTTAM